MLFRKNAIFGNDIDYASRYRNKSIEGVLKKWKSDRRLQKEEKKTKVTRSYRTPTKARSRATLHDPLQDGSRSLAISVTVPTPRSKDWFTGSQFSCDCREYQRFDTLRRPDSNRSKPPTAILLLPQGCWLSSNYQAFLWKENNNKQ